MFQYDAITEYQLTRGRHQEAIQNLERRRLVHEAIAQSAGSAPGVGPFWDGPFSRLARALRRDRPSAAVAAAEAVLRDAGREVVAPRR